MGSNSRTRRLRAESLEDRHLLAADLMGVSGITSGAETTSPVDGGTPLMGAMMGDLNLDGILDADDIDSLASVIRSGTHDSFFDMDGDGFVMKSDMDMLIHDVFITDYGDANLDRAVDMSDMRIWQTHAFRYDLGWSGGDFNGDGLTDVSDFNVWNTLRTEPQVLSVTDSGMGNPNTAAQASDDLVGRSNDENPMAQSPNRTGPTTDPLIQEGLVTGDLNGDSNVDAADIDMLSTALRVSDSDPLYDINGDGDVSSKDMSFLVMDVLLTDFGDANLDGFVDASDYVTWQDHQFSNGTGWATADFNGDGLTDVADFNVWNANRTEAIASVQDDSQDIPPDNTWDDQLQPAAVPELFGDLNQDGVLDAADIDYIHSAIRIGDYHETLDLDANGIVDKADSTMLLADAFQTVYGDANLDGEVDFTDRGAWQDNNFTMGTGWTTGDFNGDGLTDVSDFNIWNANRER